MRRLRRRGFVLIIVVVVIALMGAQLLVLSGISNSILFESETAYLEAVERNRSASGLAWAGQNAKGQSKDAFNKPVQLDLTGIGVPDTALTVTIGAPKENKARVQIKTSCGFGERRTLRHSGQYDIEL